MTVNIAGRSVPIGAILAAVGGVLAIVAAPFTWASANLGPTPTPLNGFDQDMSGGIAAVVLGIVVLALVAAWVVAWVMAWVMKVKIPAIGAIVIPAIGAIVIVAGVLVLLVPVAVYFTPLLGKESLKDMADQVKAAGGSVDAGIAFTLEILAGIVVIVGGGLGLIKKRA
jgi:hypothetical protein